MCCARPKDPRDYSVGHVGDDGRKRRGSLRTIGETQYSSALMFTNLSRLNYCATLPMGSLRVSAIKEENVGRRTRGKALAIGMIE